jgi:hypothetical protein
MGGGTNTEYFKYFNMLCSNLIQLKSRILFSTLISWSKPSPSGTRQGNYSLLVATYLFLNAMVQYRTLCNGPKFGIDGHLVYTYLFYVMPNIH